MDAHRRQDGDRREHRQELQPHPAELCSLAIRVQGQKSAGHPLAAGDPHRAGAEGVRGKEGEFAN